MCSSDLLGANDGIVSTASLLVGVAAADATQSSLLAAGIAGVVAGAMSMAAGEYVSVHSQADTEKADLDRERRELETDEAGERRELTGIYIGRGLTPDLARQVADQLMAHDALAAHARDELGITESTSARPLQAAAASAASFAVGAVIISVIGTFTRNFEAALFGNVLGVTGTDVAVVAVTFLGACAAVFLRYRQLLFATFDPEVAEVSGVRTARTDALLAVLLSALITVCMNVLGVTLIAAMLVVPPVVGRLLTDSFGRMLGISVAVGTVCGFVGVYLSYYLDWASGPAVVLTAATIFVAAYAVSGFRRRRLPAAAIDAHVG